MQARILAVLLLIVLLPLILLGGFAIRLADNEQEVIEHQFQVLIDAQLRAVDDAVQTYFTSLQQQLAAADSLPFDTEALRAYLRRDPRIRQVLVMTLDGERRHPPVTGFLTDAEERFLVRTEHLWRDMDMLYQALAQAESGVGEQADVGWYVWFWGNETNLMFWRRDAAGLLGLELEPMRVLADIINQLPTTGSNDDNLGQASIQLIDNRGVIAYQWGEFQPDTETAALAVLPLSHPLSSWKLAYHAPSVQLAQSRLGLSVWAALAAVGLALTGLAVYLYREHTRALRLARQRVNFVNQVSHELKTPLTNIRMYAELLDNELDDEAEKPRHYLAIVVAESQRLSRLIANVLDFARHQNKRLRLRPRPGKVDDVIATVLTAFKPALAAKGVTIDFQAAAGALVKLDPDVLEQILNNLLSNVEKYAGGAKLEIVSQQQNSQTIITVHDYGPGIPKRERTRIFQPFYRISSGLNEGVAGAGIGLAITRELARLHGGDLVLTPTAQGACFEVTLHTEIWGDEG